MDLDLDSILRKNDTCVCMYVCEYVCVRERERERERERGGGGGFVRVCG